MKLSYNANWLSLETNLYCDGAETCLALETNVLVAGEECVKCWERIKAFRAGDECLYARDELLKMSTHYIPCI